MTGLNDAQTGVSDLTAKLDVMNISAGKVASTLTSAFSRATQSGQTFEKTVQSILGQLARVGTQGLGQGLTSMFSSLGSVGSLPITPFADGGVVARPTFFASGNGLGLMGERGAEAIMPLARGPDGRLGLAASSPAAASANINIHIATPDPDAFQRSQVQISAALARAVMRGQRGI